MEHALDPSERVVVDKGYSYRQIWTINNEFPDAGHKTILFKTRHETFSKRLRNFNVLTHPFRHGVEKHEQVFYGNRPSTHDGLNF